VHSSHFLDGSPTAAACEGNENREVVLAERLVPNLYSKVSAVILDGTIVESCISTAVHR
jgi:hypothetical protein